MRGVGNLLEAYFIIVKKSIQDGVPKYASVCVLGLRLTSDFCRAIMMFLVNNSASHLQNELVKALYHEDFFAELTEEADDTTQRR